MKAKPEDIAMMHLIEVEQILKRYTDSCESHWLDSFENWVIAGLSVAIAKIEEYSLSVQGLL